MMNQKKLLRGMVCLTLILALFTTCMIVVLHKKIDAKKDNRIDLVQYDESLYNYIMSSLSKDGKQQLHDKIEDEISLQNVVTEDVLFSYYQNVVEGYGITQELHIASVSVLKTNEEGTKDEICKLQLIEEDELHEKNVANEKFAYINMPSDEQKISIGASYQVICDKDTIYFFLTKLKDEYSFERAWIYANDNLLQFHYKDQDYSYELADIGYTGYEEIADLTLKDNCITMVKPYQNKIHGKLLSVKENDQGYEIEVEDNPYLQTDYDFKVYNLVDKEQTAQVGDLTVGYDFADFVLNEDGLCVGALIARKEKLENIRVVLRTQDFEEMYHSSIKISCDTDYQILYKDTVIEKAAGDLLEADMDTQWFETSRIKIVPKAYTGKIHVYSYSRSQGNPAYRGVMEIEKTANGFLMVNELPLDEYLYSVVPSEMPANYPEQALAAQAVSARTYAYSHMNHSNMQKYGAHVDDSASFQVYNNMNESETTTLACRQTSGEIMRYHGNIATTYFYSTSCGFGTDMSAWTCEDSIKESDQYLVANKIASESSDTGAFTSALELIEEETFSVFITSKDNECFENEDSYFRWKYQTGFDEAYFWENLKKRYEASKQYVLTKSNDDDYVSLPIEDEGKILELEITKRAKGGAAIELIVKGEHHSYKIMTEKNIRYIMANESTDLKLSADYTKEGHVNGMLPSAFIIVEPTYDEAGYLNGYTVYGGGFGHGIGMSQNGAKGMAQNGYSYRDILLFFYQDCDISQE